MIRLLASLAIVLPVVGAVAAPALTADGRVVYVSFHEGEVVTLRGRVGFALDVELAPGERVVNVAAGNLAAIDVGVEGNHLFLKPRRAVDRMNLIVVSDRHTYQLEYRVDSLHPDDGRGFVYAVVFNYPTPERAATASLPAPSWNANYWYCGAPELRPSEAFDDGVRTYLRFPPDLEFPVPYLIDPDGEERLINTHISGDWIVVHQIADRLTLRRGKLSGCVANRSTVRTVRSADGRPAPGAGPMAAVSP